MQLRSQTPSFFFESLELRRLLSLVYHVAANGSDSNDGSSAHPFLTIQHAANLTQPGDTVDVAAGNYAGFVLGWSAPQGGTAAAPITYQGESGATINSRNSKTADGIDLETGDSYINIYGFTVLNGDASISRAGIRVAGSDHVNIVGNTCTGLGYWGIFTSHSNYTLIQNNTTSGSIKQHGIYVSNSADHPSIIGNIVFGNANCGIHLNGDISQGGAGLITNALICNNVIYNNGASGGSAINGDGLANSVIQNNLLYNNHASGISLYRQDAAGGADNNLIVNNTIVMAADARWAININSQSTGNLLFNNIILSNNSGRGSIDITSDSLSGFQSDHNILSALNALNDGAISLASWQSQTRQDLHSALSTAAVLFVNASANNYQIGSTSPALDTGVSSLFSRSAPATDLLGNPRPAGGAWDVGAYEMQAPATFIAAPDPYNPAKVSLIINGTSANDVITLSQSNTVLLIDVASPTDDSSYAVLASAVTGQIYVNGLDGDDTLILDSTGGALTMPVNFNGGGGNDTWQFKGGSYTFNTDLAASAESLSASNSAQLTFTTSEHLSSLLLDNAAATLAQNSGVLMTNSLTILNSAKFDLSNNSMIINYTGPSPLSTIRSYLASGRGPAGFGNATWNGNGINSSTAHQLGNGVDPALGYAENSSLPIQSFTIFAGQTVGNHSILIKYTRGADATLDDKLDNSDITVISTDSNNPNSGQWFLGDFDYSGMCDSSDMTAVGVLLGSAPPPASAPAVSQITPGPLISPMRAKAAIPPPMVSLPSFSSTLITALAGDSKGHARGPGLLVSILPVLPA